MRFKPHHTLTPIHIKLATALTALVRLFAQRIIDRNRERSITVGTANIRGTRDGSRKDDLVVDEVVE